MIRSNRWRQAIHFLGDIFFLILALWLTLVIRHVEFPSAGLFREHLLPFSILFVVWTFVFYVAGLYDRKIMILKRRLPGTLFNVQVVNVAIAVLFFYLLPGLQLTPKTVLFIYLVVSFALILLWRVGLDALLRNRKNRRVLLIGEGSDINELIKEINESSAYNMEVERAGPLNMGRDHLNGYSMLVADLRNEETRKMIPEMYDLMVSGIPVMDAEKIYEDIFERVPLSSLEHWWFLKDFSFYSRSIYDPVKRTVDVSLALVAGLLSLLFYPFIWLAIKIDDGGPAFITQDRIGQGGKKIRIFKFRSMSCNDKGAWVKDGDDRITKVGSLLRKTRLDELPQLYNVLKGDISLIGPRPDICGLKDKLEKKIPYYNIRTVVRPGLSGWAQVNQERPPQSVEETKERLMYDLYYIKNRSFLLDLKIILRTLGILASRTGV